MSVEFGERRKSETVNVNGWDIYICSSLLVSSYVLYTCSRYSYLNHYGRQEEKVQDLFRERFMFLRPTPLSAHELFPIHFPLYLLLQLQYSIYRLEVGGCRTKFCTSTNSLPLLLIPYDFLLTPFSSHGIRGMRRAIHKPQASNLQIFLVST